MGELDALDQLTVPAPQTGKPLQRLAVTMQLYVAGGHRPEPRRASLAMMLEAYRLAPGKFQRWMGTDDDRPRHVHDACPGNIHDAIAPLIDRPDRLLSLALLECENPPHWQAWAMLPAENPRHMWLSYATVSVPPSSALRDADAYVERVLSWVALLRPQHGTAGFALVDEIGMAHHRRGAAWPWLHRYPGLDCDVFNVQPKPGCFQSVNWLTVLGEAVLATLGGRDTVRRRLHDAATELGATPPTVTAYDTGALIRASALPMLGDRARGDIPAAYRAVNAALRPARFENYPDGPNIHLIDAPRTYDLRQATLDWVRRFDDQRLR
ncbi:MAG: type VI immunity family protein [Rhodococcus sp. (in: high G+C Gram-positive bacteria)]|uniref:type VI immunity family protein n=1 Tax=Rhodococcus sp. TaxID=1831 RepID=UPI003BB4A12D